MESTNVHTGRLIRQGYKLITDMCQSCEFNADRIPISTADYADDTDKRNCCPRTTRKTRSHTAQKIRKIGTHYPRTWSHPDPVRSQQCIGRSDADSSEQQRTSIGIERQLEEYSASADSGHRLCPSERPGICHICNTT